MLVTYKGNPIMVSDGCSATSFMGQKEAEGYIQCWEQRSSNQELAQQGYRDLKKISRVSQVKKKLMELTTTELALTKW